MESNVITEKVYCTGCPNGYGYGSDAATAALLNNNQWQNPFAYMMIMAMMRFMYGDNWQNGMAGNAEMNARFNQLSNQMADNHNTDILNEAIKGNTARIGELANNLNVDLRAIQSGICDLRSGIQQVAGDVRFSAERVINAAERGDAAIISKLQECCCENKLLVTQQGYENRLAQKDVQSALQSGHAALGYQMQKGFADSNFAAERGIDRINSGLVQGFASVGYAAEQNKCAIVSAIDAAQQRTADLLNNHWKDELALQLQDQKFKNSQLEQNIYMRDLFEKKGCKCGE